MKKRSNPGPNCTRPKPPKSPPPIKLYSGPGFDKVKSDLDEAIKEAGELGLIDEDHKEKIKNIKFKVMI